MKLKIKDIENNPDNPRKITDQAFEKLCNSIQEDPQLMEAQPIIVVKNERGYKVIAGNQRLRACKELGWEEIPAFDATNWKPDQIDRAVVKTNINAGKHDYDLLSAQYETEDLIKWGMEELEQFSPSEEDYDDLGVCSKCGQKLMV